MKQSMMPQKGKTVCGWGLGRALRSQWIRPKLEQIAAAYFGHRLKGIELNP